MLPVLKGANLGLMFLLELAVYAAVGYWGFTVSSNLAVKLLAGLGGPVLFAVVWGVFGAPKASVPLHGLGRAALEIVWFGGGAGALLAAGLVTPAAVFTVLYLVNAGFRLIWHQ
jgi:hypothetical protein